jgi:hypothetical protein
METLFIIYDVLFESRIREIIEQGMVIPRYTRIDNVVGARAAEMEAATSYVADRNNRMIVAIAEPPTIAQIVQGLSVLRQQAGHGLRAFVVPATQVI